MRFFVLILLMLFFHVSFSQNNEINHFYSDLGITHGLTNYYTSPNPEWFQYSSYHRVGFQTSSVFSLDYSLGYSFISTSKTQFSTGVNILGLGVKHIFNYDSIASFYDSTLIPVFYKSQWRDYIISIPIEFMYSLSKFKISTNIQIPVLTMSYYKQFGFPHNYFHNNIFAVWQFTFPYFISSLRIGYEIFPKTMIFFSYRYITGDETPNNHLLSMNLRYNIK